MNKKFLSEILVYYLLAPIEIIYIYSWNMQVSSLFLISVTWQWEETNQVGCFQIPLRVG